MKKRLLAGALFAMLAIPSSAFAADESFVCKINDRNAIIGGSPVTMDVAPLIIDGRTMVPVRYVAHGLGVTDDNILWIPGEYISMVELKKGNDTFHLETRSKTIAIWRGYDEDAVFMDVVPVIRNDRMYLPVRFVAEAFGKTVNWDPQTETVTIR